uniref:Uncharacterized protein n=1 Tax=Rhizophora mucronata TaxID=61149 RepID=A0A2P2J2M4_RHIMU
MGLSLCYEHTLKLVIPVVMQAKKMTICLHAWSDGFPNYLFPVLFSFLMQCALF